MDGITIIINGERYFIYGKTRVKVTEHFSESGKTMDELITVLARREIQESAQKIV